MNGMLGVGLSVLIWTRWLWQKSKTSGFGKGSCCWSCCLWFCFLGHCFPNPREVKQKRRSRQVAVRGCRQCPLQSTSGSSEYASFLFHFLQYLSVCWKNDACWGPSDFPFATILASAYYFIPQGHILWVLDERCLLILWNCYYFTLCFISRDTEALWVLVTCIMCFTIIVCIESIP